MEKKCFVIIPKSDPDGYTPGHFSRVYQYIIVPACRLAGFSPIKADDTIITDDSAWDLIKNIIESDMTICDLSARNQNVLYGFAIRQVFNLPVTVMKDMKTQSVFDILEFGAVEYDESLRIDTVQKEIETLSEALKNTFTNKGEVNSILNRLKIGPGQLIEPEISGDIGLAFTSTDKPTQTEHAAEPIPLPVISPLPDYVGDPITQHDIDKLKAGDFLFHVNYGKGEIKSIKIMAKDKLASVHFESGSKMLVLATSGYFRKINT